MAAWLLQADPDEFGINAYLLNPQIYAPHHWKFRGSVKAEEASSGDVAFMWRAEGDSGNGGLVAVGHLLSGVQRKDLSTLPGAGLWKTRPKPGQFENVVELEFPMIGLDRNNGMVPRVWVEREPVFAGHQLFTSRTGSAFRLSQQQAELLHQLWTRAMKRTTRK